MHTLQMRDGRIIGLSATNTSGVRDAIYPVDVVGLPGLVMQSSLGNDYTTVLTVSDAIYCWRFNSDSSGTCRHPPRL